MGTQGVGGRHPRVDLARMASSRSRELFPPDWALRARMLIVLALDAVLLIALTAALVYVTGWVQGGWSLTAFFVVTAAAGALYAGHARRTRDRGRAVHDRDEARVRALVDRLCVVGDLAAPAIAVARERVAQSWTSAVPWRRPCIHATTALLDALDDRRLSAVLAHELSHIAHRDAWVMTVTAAPGIWVLRGIRVVWTKRRDPLSGALAVVDLALFFGWIAVPFALLARLLSRQRELAADAGAARLTGSPATLAAALTALTGELSAARRPDLRVAAARDLLHVLPAREAHGVRRLWATHPPLRRRLRALDRLEGELQRAH